MQFIKRILKKLLYDDSGFFRDYIGEMMPYKRYLYKLKRKNNDVNCELPPDYEKEIKKFWEDNFNIKISAEGYKYFYASNNKLDINYIPEDIFFKFIIRKLNKFSMAKAYADKNMYNKLFEGVETPKTIIRNINGRFFDEKYVLLSYKNAENIVLNSAAKEKIIVKPSIDSGGGKNILLLDIQGENLSKDELKSKIRDIFDEYSEDYIIQYYFNQHDLLNDIYPFSLNTIRIITFEIGGEIQVLASVLKMGNNSNFLDKIAMGGLACGVNTDGKLNDYAFAKDVQKPLYFHPQTNFEFKDKVIPNFKDALELVKQMHKQISPYFRFVSWDIAIGRDNNPVLIEMNLRNQGVMIPQLNSGPIFGERTVEVLQEIFNG